MDQLRIKVGQILLGHIVNQYFTILPETSDSISLNNFIASITQRTSPLPIWFLLHKHRFVWRWFSIKVPIIGDFIVMNFESSSTATGADATGATGLQAKAC
jgi:hypothetical protein